MRNVITAVLAAALACAGAGAATGAEREVELCVGAKPGCFSTIQAAVDAAQAGDTIEIGPGTFAGGIMILKNLSLVGVSAGATRIDGGGPVITIGAFMGPQPTVSISRVTISGGLVDAEGVAAGGGVLIPFPGPGLPVATVSISDSVITDNRVTPSGLFPAGGFCGSAPCAVAWGGGIDSSGHVTLRNTRVTGNVAGSTPTDGSAATTAQGGGIRSHPGATLTLSRSVVSGNRVAVTLPNGQFAEGGGIADDGTLRVEDSVINGNRADATSAVPSSIPFDVQQEACCGGLFSNGSATIVRSTVSGNSVSSRNAGGDASAVSGGIDADFTLLLADSAVDRNGVTADVPAFSGFVAGALFGGLQVSGTATVRSSRIADNALTAVGVGSGANVAAAGIANLSGELTLEHTVVTANRAAATGNGGLALGGGIFNVEFGGGEPELSLTDSVVTANRIDATGPGFDPQGGGIYSKALFGPTTFPVTLTRSVIAGNKPDQCVGC